jgi:hypothetical protein
VPYIEDIDNSEILAELTSASRAQEDMSLGMVARFDSFSLRSVEPGVYIVQASGSGSEVLLHAENLVMHEAPMQVETYGSLLSFGVGKGEFAASGVAQKTYETEWPSWINGYSATVTHYFDTRGYGPDGTTNSIAGNGGAAADESSTTQPSITLGTTDTDVSPIVYEAYEAHPPLWIFPVKGQETVPGGSEVLMLSDYTESVRIYESLDGRATSAEFDLVSRNDPSDELADLHGDNWCEVGPVCHQWPTFTRSEDQDEGVELLMAGWLTLNDWQREGTDDASSGQWRAKARIDTWPVRFDGDLKTMVKWAGMSWNGVSWKLAVRLILESWGVPTGLTFDDDETPGGNAVSFEPIEESHPGLLDDLLIPDERGWERRYVYSETTPVLQALDELCHAVGIRWRINRSGIWEFFIPTPWDGISYDHTIDDDTGETDLLAVLESIHHTRRDADLRNIIYHVGTDKYGNSVTGMITDWTALWDTESDRFVGDERWAVKVDEANPAPGSTAYWEYLRRQKLGDVVEWTWAGHPTWAPGDRVQISVADVSVPEGTVVEIVSKESVIDELEMRYEETITAGVIKWGMGAT